MNSWNVCRVRKARQLSLLFVSGFISTAHFGGTESEWLSLAASDNGMISFCLDSRYSPQLWIISPPGIDPIFIYSVSRASDAKRQNIFTKPHRSVAISADVIRDPFSPHAFVPFQYLHPAVWSPRDSVCVFIFFNRKQRNGSESEYTEKLQQYSKSLCWDAPPFCTIHIPTSVFQYFNLALTEHPQPLRDSSHNMNWLDHRVQ